MLAVQLLGELTVEADGRPVAPPQSRRAWSLLAWLALHPGEHARGAVAARFWPEVLDSSARASLRSAAWSLRRALGPDADGALVAGRDRIGLRCETDVARFDADVAAGRLEDAVALCRGPLLADLDEDWVLEARDEHAERVGAVLSQLASAAGTHEDGVTWARRRLALDPLDEASARDLMSRLAAAGDRAGAIVVFDRLSDRLRTVLGLAPSAATRQLAASVRAQEPSVGEDAAAPPARADRPPLVGRGDELRALLALWAHVREGGGAVALLSGEAGIGKTRLAGELLALACADGARTARGTAVDLGGATPFGLWIELLGDLVGGLDAPPPGARWPEELARLAPSLPRRLGRASAVPADLPPDVARGRLFEAAIELAEHASDAAPLVLLLDDVHLADAPSLELAAYVARRIERLPVLLVLTRRTVPRRDAVDALAHVARERGVAVAELDLEPLVRRDVEQLVATVAALDATQRDRVIAAADGNPLLALESARATARGDVGPPSSLRGAVRTAIATLAEPARHAAELAATAGRDLGRTELAALAPPEAVLEAMDSGLFRSTDGRFGFRHALLREAVYADLDDARRVMLHEQLAGALVGRPSEAAHHLRLAGRDDLAAGRLVRAAEDAARATAFAEAAAYLQEAIEIGPPAPEPHLRLAAHLAALGRRGPALAHLETGLGLLDPADAAGRAAAHLGAARWFRGSLCHPESARDASRRGLQVLAGAGLDDRELRAELLLIRAWCEVTIAGTAAADETLEELAALGVDLEGDPLRRHDLESVQGLIALADGRLRDAEDLLIAAGSAGERTGRPDMAYGGWSNAACIAAAVGALPRALQHADRGAATTVGFPVLEFQMAGLRAFLLARLGRREQSRAATELQVELAARLGIPELSALADHDAGLLALLAGDHERAALLLGRALAGDPPVQRAEARLRRAEALARLGRADAADAEIRAAVLEPVRPLHRPAVLVARMVFAQALSARARGDVALAETRLREAAAHWRRLASDGEHSRDHLASLVDLGRPPVTGVLDPELELARVAAELKELQPVPG
jgi:DNA-binding SARP family transcriptional activator